MREIAHRDQNIYQCSQEFELLDEYLAYIEGSIDITLRDITAKLRAKEEYIECDDGQVAYLFDGLVLPDSAQMIFSRFLYNNFFLSLWATYEIGLREIAEFLSLAKGLDNFIKYENSKKNTKDFVTEILKYFEDIYKITIPLQEPINQEYLFYLYRLRNIIAHCNGRTKDIPSKGYFQDLIKWVECQPDLAISEDGWILLSGKFCRDIYECLLISFQRLYRLAYETIPGNTPRPVKFYVVHY